MTIEMEWAILYLSGLQILTLLGVWAIERALKKITAELNGQKGGD